MDGQIDGYWGKMIDGSDDESLMQRRMERGSERGREGLDGRDGYIQITF